MATSLLLSSGKVVTTDPSYNDGDVASLTMTKEGRLRVATKPGYFAPSSAGLLALNDALTVDVTDASNIVFHLKNTGSASMVAGQFTFEGSIDSTTGTDGTWFVVQAVRSDSNTVETARTTSTLTAGSASAYSWEASVNALRYFRIRCTTAVTASSIATWTVVRGSYATEPIPAIQAHSVSQSGTWTVSTQPNTGAISMYSLETTASTNAANIKTSTCMLFEISIANLTAATIYVKLYNKNSAPTVGTDVPILTIPVAANAVYVTDFGGFGKRFSAGLGIATTAAAIKTDSAAITAGAQISATYI